MKQFFLMLVLFSVAYGPAFSAGPGEPIKIAALYNLTGEMSSIDLPAYRGAQLAVELINRAGGLLEGRKLELICLDTRSDPETVAEQARQILEKAPIAGIGYCDTTYVMAAGPIFARKGVPFITSGATDPDIPEELGPGVIMTTFGDDDQAHAMAHFALDVLKARRVALWTDVSMDFTRGLSSFFKKRFTRRGGKVVSEDFFKTGDKDFSGHVARLKALSPQPDAIFVSAVPGEAVQIVAQLRSEGVTMPILSGDGFDSDIASALPAKNMADNLYFSTHSYRGQTRKEVLEFIEAYKKKFGTEPENAFAALGFDAINLLADSIKRAGTTASTPLMKALYATRSFQGVTGEISFARPSHVPVKPISIIGIKNGEYKVMETWKP